MSKPTLILFQIFGVCLVLAIWFITHHIVWALIVSSVYGISLYIIKNNGQKQRQ